MEISFDDLFKLVNPNIIDIRFIEKYNDNHVPGAVNINYNLLINDPHKYLDKNLSYYIYCQKGVTSRKVVQLLRKYGYNVFSIIGGYEYYILHKK